MASEPTHPSGTRLLDHADVVNDIGTPAGDALISASVVGAERSARLFDQTHADHAARTARVLRKTVPDG